MRFFVQILQERDLDELLELHKLLFPVKFTMGLLRQFCFRQDCLSLCLFAVKGNSRKLIGFSTTSRYWKSFFTTDRCAYLCTFGMHPDFQRRGLATDLLRITCRILHDHYQTTDLYLDMQRSNEPALRFYRQFGFDIVRFRPGFYTELQGDEADAYYMGMSLEDRRWQIRNHIKCPKSVHDLFSVVPRVPWWESFIDTP